MSVLHGLYGPISLLHMSLNQLELPLKNTTSKSRTPVSMYQFDPFFNSI